MEYEEFNEEHLTQDLITLILKEWRNLLEGIYAKQSSKPISAVQWGRKKPFLLKKNSQLHQNVKSNV